MLQKHGFKIYITYSDSEFALQNSVPKSLLLFKQHGLTALVYSYLIRNKGFLASAFLASIGTSFKDTCSNLSELSAGEFFFIKQVAPF